MITLMEYLTSGLNTLGEFEKKKLVVYFHALYTENYNLTGVLRELIEQYPEHSEDLSKYIQSLEKRVVGGPNE